jgi:hypothetical protein
MVQIMEKKFLKASLDDIEASLYVSKTIFTAVARSFVELDKRSEKKFHD